MKKDYPLDHLSGEILRRAENSAKALEASDRVRVFVYGTLKHDHGNHGCIQEEWCPEPGEAAQFVGFYRTTNKWPMVCGGIPFLYCQEGEGLHVTGEVWEVDRETVYGSLDRLEGHPHYYVRSLFEEHELTALEDQRNRAELNPIDGEFPDDNRPPEFVSAHVYFVDRVFDPSMDVAKGSFERLYSRYY